MRTDPEVELIEGTSYADLPNIETLDSEDPRSTILVLDDEIAETDPKLLHNAMQYWIRGRSKHCSILALVQKFHSLGIVERNQLTHIFMLELDSLPEAKKVIREYADVKKVFPFYEQIIQEEYAWLTIDLTARADSVLRYRHCFGDMDENEKLPLPGEKPSRAALGQPKAREPVLRLPKERPAARPQSNALRACGYTREAPGSKSALAPKRRAEQILEESIRSLSEESTGGSAAHFVQESPEEC